MWDKMKLNRTKAPNPKYLSNEKVIMALPGPPFFGEYDGTRVGRKIV
jgi:hypothetical protein